MTTATVRTEPVEPLQACALVGIPASRVSPRRATYFSLSRQRNLRKRKATRWSGSPALRFGATCGARQKRGLARTRLRLRQSRALIRFCLRSSAQPDGWGKEEKDHKPKTEFKSGVLEARSASRTGIPSGGHVCTRAQRTRPHGAPFSRPAGRGKGGGLGVGSQTCCRGQDETRRDAGDHGSRIGPAPDLIRGLGSGMTTNSDVCYEFNSCSRPSPEGQNLF